MGWNGSMFNGNVLFSSKFAITIQFTLMHNVDQWNLTTVYDPCHGQERQNFVNWLNSIYIANQDNWMFIGDFNFYRS
jgi:hypothetical protein